MSRACHRILPATSIDSSVFLSSQGPHNISRFLHLPGGGLSYPPDKAAGNLRVSNFWREQVERKDKCYNSTYKGIIYQIAIRYNYSLRRKVSLYLENTD